MTHTTLITATEESTGKTATAVALAQLATDRGESVGFMKPKGTRVQSTAGKTLDPDPLLARDVLGLDDAVADLEPVVYSQTFVRGAVRGHESGDVLVDRIREAFETLSRERDRLVVEGGSAWYVGGVVDLTDPEVADLLDAQVVVLSGYAGVEDLDAVLAAADAAGDRLAGVVFNAVPDGLRDELERDVASFLDARGVPVLGVLPRVRDLAGVTVGDLADHLGARVLTDAGLDASVERFHVGAMGGETALRFFRRTTDAVVVTGGDRADVQAAAVEAPGVKCLVLTGGYEPTSAVLGRAEEAGLPVLLVETDTLTTVERAEALVDGGRVPDRESVERMRDLLVAHADVETLLGGGADEGGGNDEGDEGENDDADGRDGPDAGDADDVDDANDPDGN